MSRPNEYYPDGFRGGNELPTDTALDQLVYPAAPEPPTPFSWIMDETSEQRMARLDAESVAKEMRNYERDRKFTIEEGNVTGEKTGPPRNW